MTPLDLDAIGRRENVMRLMVSQCRPIWGFNHSNELLELCGDTKALISEVEALRKTRPSIAVLEHMRLERDALRAKLEKAKEALRDEMESREARDLDTTNIEQILAELESK
jgi:Zn-dependent M32 family carboxypeptidase